VVLMSCYEPSREDHSVIWKRKVGARSHISLCRIFEVRLCVRVPVCARVSRVCPGSPGVFLPVPKCFSPESGLRSFVAGPPPHSPHHRLKGRLRSPRSTQVLSTRSNPRNAFTGIGEVF